MALPLASSEPTRTVEVGRRKVRVRRDPLAPPKGGPPATYCLDAWRRLRRGERATGGGATLCDAEGWWEQVDPATARQAIREAYPLAPGRRRRAMADGVEYEYG